MYKMTYAEIMEGSAHAAREREKAGARSRHRTDDGSRRRRARPRPKATEAVAYVQRLWTFFIENLTDPNNELAGSLKQDLISIGLWAIAESDRILADPSKSF